MITGPVRALLLSLSVPKAACTLEMMSVDPESFLCVCGGLTHPKVLSDSRAGSSESGESSKGSSSHTTNSVAMVDGFALFALAIQDNLRAKLTKLKSGGGECRTSRSLASCASSGKRMGRSRGSSGSVKETM